MVYFCSNIYMFKGKECEEPFIWFKKEYDVPYWHIRICIELCIVMCNETNCIFFICFIYEVCVFRLQR